MLQLILGRTGYGKTEYIKNIIKNSSDEKEIIFLVPDQVSFNMERDIINLCSAKKAEKVKVFTFDKLAEDVFKIYGGIAEKRIDDNGRNLLMSLAINDCVDNLTMYGSSAKAGRLTKLMLSAIKEFKACQITVDDLVEIAKRSEKALKDKLNEIALIYQNFTAKLENSYIEPWDLLTRAGKVLNENDYFTDKIMLIDGFEGFDKEKYSIIQRAIAQCDVYASLCCEDIYSEEIGSVFSHLNDTGKSLVALAKELGAVVKPFVKLENPYRFKNEELKILEKNFFCNKQNDKKIKTENIRIYKANNLYQETQYVAATIRNLAISGYSYGDINVICSDSSKYMSMIESVFKAYEVPVFVAKPRMVDGSPLIRLVLTALNIAEFGFKTADVLSLVKTELCGLSEAEISMLENYVYIWRIEGKQWLDEFTMSTDGYDSSGSEKLLEAIEKTRKRITKPLLDFKKSLQNPTVFSISSAIYNLLKAYNSDAHLVRHHRNLKDAGMLEEAQEQIRIWDELMATLDQFVGILGEDETTVKLYLTMLKDVLAKQEIMDIPLKLDSVMVSTANQAKEQGKVTFLLGCVLEEFPRLPNSDTVFTQYEKKQLEGQAFIKNIEKEILLERFYTYSCALSCSEKLFVSYDGTQIASEIIGEIQNVFDIEIIEDLPSSYFANSCASVFSTTAKLYRHNSEESETFKSLVENDQGLKEKFEKVKNSADKKDLFIEDKQFSQKLFKKEYLSPSQIDVYYKCKFRHFCQYGLKLKERRVAEIDVMNYGSVMHYIFEGVLKEKYQQKNQAYDLKVNIAKFIKKYADEQMGGYDKLDPRDKYRLKRVEKTAFVITQRLVEEIEQSQFKPEFWELEISKKGQFEPLEVEVNGQKVYVGGKVDRADTFIHDDKKYIRVIDYKTGKKEFKISDVLSGMSLQMLIYLAALSEAKNANGDNEFEPAAVLYMPSAYPEVSAKRDEKIEKADKKRRDLLCMNGLLLDDDEIVTAMEAQKQGKYIPVTEKNTENLISGEDLSKVFGYIKQLIAKMAVEIEDGDVRAKPLMIGENACTFCQYKTVCLLENEEECYEITTDKEEILRLMGE